MTVASDKPSSGEGRRRTLAGLISFVAVIGGVTFFYVYATAQQLGRVIGIPEHRGLGRLIVAVSAWSVSGLLYSSASVLSRPKARRIFALVWVAANALLALVWVTVRRPGDPREFLPVGVMLAVGLATLLIDTND